MKDTDATAVNKKLLNICISLTEYSSKVSYKTVTVRTSSKQQKLIFSFLALKDRICILFFCHSHSHSHSYSALCNVYPVALDSTRR